MGYGTNGCLLEIDLSARTSMMREVPEQLRRTYLGGSGLAAYYLYPPSPPGQHDDLFIIAGLLTGTAVPTACKVSVCARSPLTGLWAESTVGGYWGQQLKTAGFDGLVIRGESSEPVYLWIDGREVKFMPAAHLWGKDTFETADKLRDATHPRAQVCCIGPAGENQVLISSIMFGGHDSRAAGRCGMGALFGKKRLKAIVVRGEGRVPVAHPLKLAESLRANVGSIKQYAKGLHDFGTAGGVQAVEANGDLPIKNWTQGSWEEGARKISGQAQAASILTGHYACWACPIRCGKDVEVKVGPYAGSKSHGPEYETCAGFGSMILNEDMHWLAAANDLCNRLGLDTISASSVIAMAMELTEHGIDIPGAEGKGLKWGDMPRVLEMIQLIAERRGAGEFLGQGVRAMGESLGGIAPEFAIHTKGLEIAYHDPRAFTSMAANYATANRGGCHLEGLTYFVESGALPQEMIGFHEKTTPHSTEGKGILAQRMQDLMNAMNALGLCKFLLRGRVSAETMCLWIKYALDWDLSVDDLFLTGERLHNLKRMYNVRLGISRKDDTLPARLLTHDRKSGRAAGSLPHLGKMLAEYYRARGWSEEGIPTRERLESLGLGFTVAGG